MDSYPKNPHLIQDFYNDHGLRAWYQVTGLMEAGTV